MSILSKFRKILGLQPTDPPLISVVLNFRKGISLSDEALHAAIIRAWKRDVDSGLKEHVVNKPPICFVKFEETMLMLSNVNKPYCPPEHFEQALAEFPELRQKQVARDHRAFLAIDLLPPKDGLNKARKLECYRLMCRLAAEFVDDNCLGVYLPEIGHMRPFDSTILSALKSEQPLEQLRKWGEPPVMAIEDDDPRLQAAVAEARRRWPEFVKKFEQRRPEQVFSVKALFTDGEDGEWMWITVSSVKDTAIEGTLANKPVNVHKIREGDRIVVQAAEIGDWVYQEEDRLIGGFSLSPR